VADNHFVFDNQRTGPHRSAKTRCADEYKKLGLGVSGENETWRRQRGPPNIATTSAPAHPGRSPLDLWNPNPSHRRVVHPPSIMVTSPRPGLVALPIPAAIGPNPFASAVRSPLHCYMRGTPAAAVRSDFHPSAMRRQRCLKFCFSVDLHRGSYFQVSPGWQRDAQGREQA
jgi:hypothetical protein